MKFRLVPVVGALVVLAAVLGVGYYWGSWDSSQAAEAAVITSEQEKEFTVLDAYKAGMKRLWEEGPEAADQYLDQEMKTFGDLKILYGKAHVAYTKGKYEDAEETLQYILAHENEPLLHAMSNYSLGLIRNVTGNQEEALVHLGKAYEYFDEEGHLPNVYRCLLEMVKSHILSDEISLASSYLDRAFSVQKATGINLGTFYGYKSHLAFMGREYGESREFFRRSLKEFREINNLPSIANTLTSLALLEIMHGNFDVGKKLTDESMEIATDLVVEVEERSAYSKINLILLGKCNKDRDYGYLNMITEVNNHADKVGDENLKELLDIVVNWDCSNKEKK